MDPQQIVQVKIHPAIGIARVGNSPMPPFVGPESPDAPPEELSTYKDVHGMIVRQAARFRLYGYNSAGEVVRELKITDDDVKEIAWSVQVANKKAAWYQFHIPLDIPEAAHLPQASRARRNPGKPRADLIISPTRRTLSVSEHGTTPSASFDDGKIMGRTVPLGEMSVEENGRLLVSGADGTSGTWMHPEPPITGVANNDGWFDNVCDGPVTAEVTLNGKKVTAAPAWVVVGPPHYAPGVKTVRTLYDLLEDVFYKERSLPVRPQVSYDDDIEPILARFCQLQWVNQGFATQFGWKGPHHFLDPEMRRRLRDPGESSRELRRQIYVQMRDYDRDGTSPLPWPWLYGDAMSGRRPTSERQHIMLSTLQDAKLAQWADGRFTPGPLRPHHTDVDDAPVASQPKLLERGALENCAADAFHPGCEVTWPMRHKTMYSEPFRILHRTTQERDYGDHLEDKDVFSKDGPLHAQGPGDLTRWMAAPWQCDTASCRSGYQSVNGLGPRYSPYLPTFWPAQMPNQVLKAADFDIVNDTGQSDETRRQAFERRAVWLRGLRGGTYDQQRRQMIDDWYKFGIVHERAYTGGDGKFPDRIQVESPPGAPLDEAPDHANLVNIQVPQAGPPLLAAAAGTWAGTVPAEQVEEALVSQAISEAVRATGYDEAAITAGYLEKLDPLHDAL
ncbi:LodA/GoxA family CTQ-dependent oxidase [Streptomyces sp. NPDC002643]